MANAPNRKYFSEASLDLGSSRRIPASTYRQIETISIPRKIMIRSVDEARMIIPTVQNRIRL